MSIENRLKSELEREGNREVDVDALYAATRERIDAPRRRARTPLLVAASAIAVLGVTGGGIWLGDWQGDDRGGDQEATSDGRRWEIEEGPVDTEFTCRYTVPNGWRHGAISTTDPQTLAWRGVERFQFIRQGDTGTVRAGRTDGELTAELGVTKKPDGWRVDSVERCTGPKASDVPDPGRFELGRHGRAFPEPPPDEPTGPHPVPDRDSLIPIDDRRYYNEVGVIDHRTVFAAEEKYEGEYNAFLTGTDGEIDPYFPFYTRLEDGELVEQGFNFFGFDSPFKKRDADFAFPLLYSTEPAILTAELKDGSTVEATEFRRDDWQGTLYTLLAPRQEVERYIVERDGDTTTYPPEVRPR